jgi:uncharacterized protein (TIGR02246 family)
MKRTILSAALLTFGCFSLPVLAQQPELQELMNATNALGTRESDLLSKKDAAGIASLFTSDGLLVMLAPQYEFNPGRDAILKHYQAIIDSGATSITLELKNLELRAKDSVWAAGNYSVTVKDKTIQGNWFRILVMIDASARLCPPASAPWTMSASAPSAAACSASATRPTCIQTLIPACFNRATWSSVGKVQKKMASATCSSMRTKMCSSVRKSLISVSGAFA